MTMPPRLLVGSLFLISLAAVACEDRPAEVQRSVAAAREVAVDSDSVAPNADAAVVPDRIDRVQASAAPVAQPPAPGEVTAVDVDEVSTGTTVAPRRLPAPSPTADNLPNAR